MTLLVWIVAVIQLCDPDIVRFAIYSECFPIGEYECMLHIKNTGWQ